MDGKPKVGLLKFRVKKYNLYTEKEKVVGNAGQAVLSLATRTQSSPCEPEFSRLLGSLQPVMTKTDALCSAAQRMKYLMIIL